MFIQAALTVIFRRNQVQTLALRPAWLTTVEVYLGFLHTNVTTAPPHKRHNSTSTQTSQQHLQLDQNHLLPLAYEFIIYQSSYHSLPHWLLTAWSSKDKLHLSLPTPRRQTGRAEVQLHSFLTSALQGGKPQPHALADLSSVTMLYELQTVDLCSHLAGNHQSCVWPGTPHCPPNPCPVLTPPSAKMLHITW